MENKNFEKKNPSDFESDTYQHSDLYLEGQANGYNTCLDRTNAKGIYEAAINLNKAVDTYWNVAPAFRYKYEKQINEAQQKLQTELKKSEQH